MEALEDFTLRILLVCGIVSLILGSWLGEHPEIDWMDGFAIILAVVIVVVVTAFNDY
jgi:Ca2+ transporting ATPase